MLVLCNCMIDMELFIFSVLGIFMFELLMGMSRSGLQF